MSAAQIIAQLNAALQKLEEAQSKVVAAGEAASEARTLVAGALEGSSGQLVSQIDKLIQALSQVAGMHRATKEQATTEYGQSTGHEPQEDPRACGDDPDERRPIHAMHGRPPRVRGRRLG